MKQNILLIWKSVCPVIQRQINSLAHLPLHPSLQTVPRDKWTSKAFFKIHLCGKEDSWDFGDQVSKGGANESELLEELKRKMWLWSKVITEMLTDCKMWVRTNAEQLKLFYEKITHFSGELEKAFLKQVGREREINYVWCLSTFKAIVS